MQVDGMNTIEWDCYLILVVDEKGSDRKEGILTFFCSETNKIGSDLKGLGCDTTLMLVQSHGFFTKREAATTPKRVILYPDLPLDLIDHHLNCCIHCNTIWSLEMDSRSKEPIIVKYCQLDIMFGIDQHQLMCFMTSTATRLVVPPQSMPLHVSLLSNMSNRTTVHRIGVCITAYLLL